MKYLLAFFQLFENVPKVVIQITIFLIILITIPNACQSKKDTIAMLKEHPNFEIVKVGGYAWFGCPSHTTFWHTKFVVKDKRNGKIVNGCYCTGFVKRVVLEDQDGLF